MHIDREQFKEYMEQILKQIELLHLKTDKVLSQKKDDEIKLLDNQDLCQLLHVNKRTLQRYRSKGILKYVRIGGKTFYTTENINQLIKHQNESF